MTFESGNRASGSAPPAQGTRPPLEAEFSAEFRNRYRGLCRALAEYVDSMSADDIAQQAFVVLWTRYYAKGTRPTDVDTLLFTIARRRMADQLRFSTRTEALEDEYGTTDEAERLKEQARPARAAEGNMLQARIDYLVNAMPYRTRQVFRAVMEHDGDVAAAAEQLDMSYHTARGHFQRAKQRLHDSLAADGYAVPPIVPRGRSGGKEKDS